MTFPATAWESAGRLSPAARAFLERVAADPSLLRRDRFGELLAACRAVIPTLVGFDPARPYGLQPWPVLLTPSRRRELARAAVGLARIVRTLPARMFGGDPAAVAAYYGLESELLAALLLAEPTALESTICRGDFVDGPGGVVCVELNFGNVASWQDNAVSAAYLASPPIAGWVAEAGLDLVWEDTVGRLFRHAVATCAARPALQGEPGADGRLDLAVVAATGGIYGLDNHPVPVYRDRFAAALAELAPGRRGEVHVVGAEDVVFERGRLVVAGAPVHGVIEELDRVTPRELFRAHKAGRLELFTGPIGPLVLGDKRNLALLSERCDGGTFDAAERELIRRHVPWTRRVERRPVAYGGAERPLPELLATERGAFVLKQATAVGGRGVVVGRSEEAAAWRAAVERALAEGSWVAQEYVDTPTYPFQAGEEGWSPHRLVWGPFVFGQDYAGLFVRLLPTAAGPVVNLGRGAVVGLAFEVAGA